VGSVFRSSDAFGVKKILISGYSPTPPRPEITKTAIGAEEFVDWQYFDSTPEVLEYLSEQDYTLIGLEQTDSSVSLPVFNANKYERICLLMGNEVTGIDDELLSYVAECVNIPQFGHKHSLNISVATGVALYGLLQKFYSA
jgi:tRNA G18 (ribose-2'-O)-methylase SpoU